MPLLAVLTLCGVLSAPVYKLAESPSCEGVTHPVSIQSWRECAEVAKSLYPRVTDVPGAPSMALGRAYPRGCYVFPKRVREGLQGVFWNEVAGKKGVGVNAAGRALCKHKSLGEDVGGLGVGVRQLREKIPSSKVTRSANVSQIVVGDWGGVQDVIKSLTKDGLTFQSAGEKFSLTTTETGQHLGLVYENTLLEPINDAIFNGKAEVAVAGPALKASPDATALFGGMKTSIGYHLVLVHQVDSMLTLTEAQLQHEALNDEVALNGVYISYGLSRPAMLREEDRENEL